MNYIDRELLDEIKKWIDRKEIIAIRGPRQSGKTTLLKMLVPWLKTEKGADEKHIIYVSFEDRERLEEFYVNPKDFIGRYVLDYDRHFFLLDEAQYCLGLGQKLKLLYDLFENVKFIITGSSSLELKNQTGKFLVGRILEFELSPLNFYEFLAFKDDGLSKAYRPWKRKLDLLIAGKRHGFEIKKGGEIFTDELSGYLDEFILFGGFPAVVLAKTKEEKILVLKNLINTYIDRDIATFLQITDTIKFRRLMTTLASLDGSMLRLDKLSNEVGSYFKEMSRLLDALEQTYIIRRISPYHKNLVTELKKEQKVYFVDTGLRNMLIENFSAMDKRPDAGILAENFVLNEVHLKAKLHFWRTTSKTEVDFIATGVKLLPIEIKFRHFWKPEGTRSLYGFLDEYGPKTCLVITKDFWGKKIFKKSNIVFLPIVYV